MFPPGISGKPPRLPLPVPAVFRLPSSFILLPSSLHPFPPSSVLFLPSFTNAIVYKIIVYRLFSLLLIPRHPRTESRNKDITTSQHLLQQQLAMKKNDTPNPAQALIHSASNRLISLVITRKRLDKPLIFCSRTPPPGSTSPPTARLSDRTASGFVFTPTSIRPALAMRQTL